MSNLNTTQVAHDLLGPSMRIYHQVLVTHANQPRLRIDKLGAGDFVFEKDSTVTNPITNYQQDGLDISFIRPANVDNSAGVFATVPLQNISLPAPQRFVITGTFQHPKQVLLNQQSMIGTYAPAILFNVDGNRMGATSQFRTSGQRLNLPGTNVMPNRPDISPSLSNKVIDPQNPSPFTLVLLVERSAGSSTGEGRLYVEDQLADSFVFTFQNGLTSSSVIEEFLVGLGTASGSDYQVSVVGVEYEIWT